MDSDGRHYSDHFAALSTKHGAEVVRWALDHRQHVSKEARNHLDEAISMDVRLNGFRGKNAPDAPVEILVNPVSRAARVNARVANAVFGVWWESKTELKELILQAFEDAQQRDSLNTETEPTQEEFQEHLDMAADAVLARHPSLEEHEVRLMALLTGDQADINIRNHLANETLAEEAMIAEALGDGELTTSQQGKALFANILEQLESLSPDAPDWDAPFIRLSHQTDQLRKRKMEERERLATLAERINDMIQTREDVFTFFEWDPAERLPNQDGPWANPLKLSDALDALINHIEDYESVREPGATYSEESKKAERRAALQHDLLAALNTLQEFAAPYSPEADMDSTSQEDSPESPPQGGGEALREENDSLRARLATLNEEADAAHRERDEARETASGLESARDDAVATSDALRQENDDLRKKLWEAQEESKSLRAAYTAQPDDDSVEKTPDFRSVSEVLDYVQNRWPDRLRISLNSSSDRKLVFDHPNRFYAALEWLGTTYRDSKTGAQPIPDLQASLAEVYGWDYVPHQSEVTMGKYRSDYETIDNGRRYRLESHIGRGIGRTTGQIRVAFAWDEERQLVIVGYVGRHQRTDAS